MTKTIPEIRQEMINVVNSPAEVWNVGALFRRIAIWEEGLHRRPAIKRARPTAKKMTEDLKVAIETHAIMFPDKPNREIGRMFGVDGGRVSEVLAGFRGE